MDYHQLFCQLTQKFPDILIKENHLLAPYTTLKIGGPSDIFIHTRQPKEFHNVLVFISNLVVEATTFEERNHAKRVSTAKSLLQDKIALTILGNGSNILISDSGIRGVVIKNTGNHISVSPQNPSPINVSSGTSLAHTINFTLNHNLLGLEHYAYIPTTIGGAIHSHIHGVGNHQISEVIESIKYFNLSTGKTVNVKANKLSWSYDHSEFQNHPEWIILSVTLNLNKQNSNQARQQVNDIISQKSLTQPLNSAGCVFKNPQNDSAGRIVDQLLNLKGYSIGGAQVSDKHANFIVNNGQATAKDYLALIKHIQHQAKQELNLELEPEIKLFGQF